VLFRRTAGLVKNTVAAPYLIIDHQLRSLAHCT